MEKAAFLDRDGTIIEDTGYVGEISKVKFLPGSSEGIKLLNNNGFKVIVITNQAGVARGYFSEERVKEINEYIRESLARDGAQIDEFYYCPHHVDGIIEEYRKDCYFRKPNPGMIEKAVSDFDIDLKESFVIGDKNSDIEAGRRAGCRNILLTGEASQDGKMENGVVSDHTAYDLFEAAKWIIESEQGKDNP